MKNKTNEKAITLIALVVTIIVLIILSAVVIFALTGRNNIIEDGQLARCMNVYYGADDQMKLAYNGVRSNIEVKTAMNSTYDARKKESVLDLVKIMARDLNDPQFTFAYKYVEGEPNKGDKAYIWVKVKDSAIQEALIEKEGKEGAEYNKPLHDTYAVAKITIGKQTASYKFEVDIERDTPVVGETESEKTLMQGTSYQEFITAEELKGEDGETGGGIGDGSNPIELPAVGEAPPSEGWTVEQAKGLVARDGLKAHMGEKVAYSPKAGGTWRIFYYDNDNYFGSDGAVYLMRDFDTELAIKASNKDVGTEADTTYYTHFRRLNPLFNGSVADKGSGTQNINTRCAARFPIP